MTINCLLYLTFVSVRPLRFTMASIGSMYSPLRYLKMSTLQQSESADVVETIDWSGKPVPSSSAAAAAKKSWKRRSTSLAAHQLIANASAGQLQSPTATAASASLAPTAPTTDSRAHGSAKSVSSLLIYNTQVPTHRLS